MVMAPAAEPIAHGPVELNPVEMKLVKQPSYGVALTPQRFQRFSREWRLFPVDGLVQVPDPARANEAMLQLDVAVPALEGLSHGKQLMGQDQAERRSNIASMVRGWIRTLVFRHAPGSDLNGFRVL